MRKRTGDSNLGAPALPEKRQRKYVSHKELMRLRAVADGNHDATVAVKDATYDPWSENAVALRAEEKDAQDERFDFLPPKEKIKAPDTLKHKPISLVASGKEVPAVRKPTGGYSYNPLYDEYEARLAREGAKAVDAERSRLADEEAERLKWEAAARSAAEAEAAEARAELSEWDEDSAWEGVESGADELAGGAAAAKAKRPERKTKVQRNRAQRRKEEQAQRKHEAAVRKQRADVDRAKKIAREVAERERTLALAREDFAGAAGEDAENEAEEEEQLEGGEEKLRRRQLGNARLPEKDLELVLPDELQESLRLLKPEGNLLKDRYRSLLVRGKVETRKHIPFKKQARVTYTEKWSFKDFRI